MKHSPSTNINVSIISRSCCLTLQSPPRFSPGKDWPVNTNLQSSWSLLDPIKEEFGPALSWSDLILLAGTTALEVAADINIPFCTVGRVDAEDGEGWSFLKARVRFEVCLYICSS